MKYSLIFLIFVGLLQNGNSFYPIFPAEYTFIDNIICNDTETSDKNLSLSPCDIDGRGLAGFSSIYVRNCYNSNKTCRFKDFNRSQYYSDSLNTTHSIKCVNSQNCTFIINAKFNKNQQYIHPILQLFRNVLIILFILIFIIILWYEPQITIICLCILLHYSDFDFYKIGFIDYATILSI